MCIYIYIYMYRPNASLVSEAARRERARITANLRAKILDLGGLDSSRVLFVTGLNSHLRRESPRSAESTNLSRDNLSGEIGRRLTHRAHPRGGSAKGDPTAVRFRV